MLKTRLLGASALVTTLIVGAPAMAAVAPADAAAPSDAAATTAAAAVTVQDTATAPESTEAETVTVTGSRIRRPNVEAAVPITSIGGEEFFQQGQNNVGDTLNDLPQLRSTFAQQNPGAGVGIAGLNLLDLRGLGTVRTLVLVNGRRHVPADILNNASSPDVNTIPNDLIERVDVVTGGNSAVYGSDAIAGVVNFILRKDYDGAQIRASAGVSSAGFGGNQFISAMAGKNFADGRGNVTVQTEYARQERIYASDIPFFRRADGFVTVDADAGIPGSDASDGFPDAVFLRDIRSATIHRYGLVAVPQPQTGIGGTPQCGVGTLANNGPTNTNGTSFNCNYIFDQAGNLTLQNGTRVGTGPTGTFIGGNGQTSREGTQLSILPSLERYNTNVLAHYSFSRAFELFFEGKYSVINAVGNQLGPTFLNNTTGSLGSDARLNPRLDNPFLSAAARTTIANAYLANNCTYTLGAGLGGTCVNNTPGQAGATPAQEATRAAALAARNAAIAAGTYRFQFARNLTDSPDRDEFFHRTTMRFVGGLRGSFNDDWSYELSGNYGKFKEIARMGGFVNRQRFLLSLDAGRNPVTGAIQCRSQFDAAARVGAPGYTESAATLASDIAACVPYNPFGGSDNSAAVSYFSLPITNTASISQTDIQGFVSGDLSQLFELPGGPIRFVVGGEYRREKAKNDSDVAADTGISNSVFLGDVNAKAVTVKEAYGEVQIPILRDMPFFHELTISGAGRISDYNTAVGTTYTYNGGVEWAPVRDIRFRANYGRAVRAPNVSEAGFPSVNNFANGFVDPCNINSIGANAIRTANCNSALTAAQRANLPQAGYSLGVISGSNPNLSEEKSDSYTIGAVITPRWLPGFSLTADYYDITVKGVIVSLSAQTIVNNCYDSPGLTSPTCGLFTRNLSGSNGAFGELPGQINFYTAVQGPNNFAKRKRRGLDIEASYRKSFSEDFKLATRVIYTHSFQVSNFENSLLPDFENRLLSEVGDPKDEARFNLDVTTGPFTIGYVGRYIGPQLTSTYENFYPLSSACTTNTTPVVCPPLNSDAIEIRSYGSVLYHNLRFDFDVNGAGGDSKAGGLNFYAGIDNVTNKKPPYGTTATGAGTSIFNIRGRAYYAGVRARF
jgi:outer membrane receptor protein involved in Fe transport